MGRKNRPPPRKKPRGGGRRGRPPGGRGRGPGGGRGSGGGGGGGGDAWKQATFLERTAAALHLPQDEVVQRLSRGLRPSVRVNPLRFSGDVSALVDAVEAEHDARLLPISWCPGAFHYDGDKHALASSRWVEGGELFIQNASSFVPSVGLLHDVVAEAADGERGVGESLRVLDICAAPGGKSTHLAALLHEAGVPAELWLNDGIETRLPRLRDVLGVLGVTEGAGPGQARVSCIPGQYIDKELEEASFDRILLDAQCGGEGMVDLRRGDALKHWNLPRVEKYRRLQQRMLMAAWRVLRPGGVLVYSTCTFAPEENEVPLSHLLKHREDARVEALPFAMAVEGRALPVMQWGDLYIDEQVRDAVRLAPTEWFEGFFVCRVRKLGG